MASIHIRLLPFLAFAGLAGGIAEIVWIVLYAQLTPLTASEVSRHIVLSIAPALAGSTFAPMLGAGIHLVLSVLLVCVFGLLVWAPLAQQFKPGFTIVAFAAALIFVWAINFSVVLPHINPEFLSLMPYPVTFFSKLLFGLVAGWSLYNVDRRMCPAQTTDKAG